MGWTCDDGDWRHALLGAEEDGGAVVRREVESRYKRGAEVNEEKSCIELDACAMWAAFWEG